MCRVVTRETRVLKGEEWDHMGMDGPRLIEVRTSLICLEMLYCGT